ncbi:UNVERIFIED_ORG: type IV pilus assembly protein PilE [Comamonas terrigena]
MRKSKGFTLIELMVAVAVVGILAAVAYPSYMEHVRKTRRVETQTLMMDVVTRQQQRMLDVRSYATTLSDLGVTVPAQVSSAYTLTLTLSAAGAVPGFTLTAAPQGAQTRESCGTLSVTNRAVKSPAQCW